MCITWKRQCGQRVTFAKFLRYGLPITLCQLAMATVYVLVLGRIGV